MEGLSDTYYINRILAGDTSCFACLLDKYSQPLFALIFRIVQNREDAEELTEDVFIKAFRQLESFRGEGKFCQLVVPDCLQHGHIGCPKKENGIFINRRFAADKCI